MTYRVVVWGTGNVGQPALRTVISNPELELVGVLVSHPSKVGRDAGELCGVSRTGVRASQDVDAVLGIPADAVVYAASGDFRPVEALADIERCLRAGRNVVSTSAYPLYDPASAPEAIRTRFAEACRAGGASLFLSGVDPGYINDIVPLLLSGLCEEIHEVRAFEYFNYATYHAPDAVRNLVGFGMPMDQTPPMVAPGIPTSVWGGVVRLTARALGIELDEIVETSERLPLERTVTVPVGTFEAGTQGALRFEVLGMVGGTSKIAVEHVTRIVDDIAPDWPAPLKGGCAHGVRMRGKPNIELSIASTDEKGDHVGGGNTTAAARIVNAIPAVCRAPAGLLDALDVPFVIGRGLLR